MNGALTFLDTPIAPLRLPDLRAEPPSAAPLRPAVIDAPGISPVVERLMAGGALAVTTGQQPGLLGGPLYTLHKALSAAAVAARLEQEWGSPVVPVFWVAGDDHDFAEARGAAWLDTQGEIVRFSLPDQPPDAALTPMYRLPLGLAAGELCATLERSVQGLPFADATVEWALRHWTPATTMAGAFGASLAELLAPFGVVCVDSTHVAVKRALAPLLRQALMRSGELEEGLAQLERDHARQGTTLPVALTEGASLVFLEGPAGRDRLVRDREGFMLRRARISGPCWFRDWSR